MALLTCDSEVGGGRRGLEMGRGEGDAERARAQGGGGARNGPVPVQVHSRSQSRSHSHPLRHCRPHERTRLQLASRHLVIATVEKGEH